MPYYRVNIAVDAVTSVNVHARNEDEAKRKAMEVVDGPHICHACANDLDVGDPVEAVAAYEIEEEDANA